MKVFFVLVMGICLLTSCKRKSLFYGKWRFRELTINGTLMDSALLGSAFIQFNADGTYAQKLFGAQESGKFSVSNDTLKLFCTSDNQVAHKYYLTFLTDSFHLHLRGISSKNSMSVELVRI